MKKIQIYSMFIILVATLFSCEDVVNVDLDTATPKLVIDASIKWNKDDNGALQTISLSTTSSFYSETVPPATGASVNVKNLSNDAAITYLFSETSPGTYVCQNFEPVLNNEYELTIIYNSTTYKGISKLMPTPTIEFAEQTLIPGFSGKDIIQFKYFYEDDGLQDNFYLSKIKNSKVFFPEYSVFTDEFFQGNLMFDVYIDEDLETGDVLDYSLQGITQEYSDYMAILISISGGDSGGPFATPPATLRGNMINQNNPNDYPLGYFSLSQIDTGSYTIE